MTYHRSNTSITVPIDVTEVSLLADFFFNRSLLNSIHDRGNNSSIDWNREYESLYDVPAGLIALLSFFYGSISIVAVVGNSLVMWIVATSRRMQNVTNCFIANLALADIVIGLFAIPFQFQAALLQRWNLPHFMCAFCPFVQVLSVNVSVFTLTAIAVDRHRAILNPLSARPSKKIAKIIIGGIWLLALAIALPMAFALRVDIVQEVDYDAHVVYTKPFCVPYNMSESSMVIYRMVLFFLQYLTPLCVISFVYARMSLRLWGSRAPGNAQDSRDANLMKNKKKVIKMLVIVVALFALCWLPLQTYQVLQTCFPLINEYRYINIVFFCSDWLAMSNSCYNPFIYGIYNEKFKREFKQRFPCGQRGWRHPNTNESFDMDKNNSTVHTRHSSVRSMYDWRRSTRGHGSMYYSGSSNSNAGSRPAFPHQNLLNRKPSNNFHFDTTNNNQRQRTGFRNNITFCLDSTRNNCEASSPFTRNSNRTNNGSVQLCEEIEPCASILNRHSHEHQDISETEMYVFPDEVGTQIISVNVNKDDGAMEEVSM